MKKLKSIILVKLVNSYAIQDKSSEYCKATVASECTGVYCRWNGYSCSTIETGMMGYIQPTLNRMLEDVSSNNYFLQSSFSLNPCTKKYIQLI